MPFPKPPLHKRIATWLGNERGVETIEWLGVILVVMALLGSVAVFMGGAGGTPVAKSVRDTVSSWVADIEDGQLNAGELEPGQIEAGRVTAPALGVPILVGGVGGGNTGGGNSGGGTTGGSGGNQGGNCGWFQWACDAAGAVWNGVTWVGEQISTGWNAVADWWNSESANWVKGILTGAVAALLIIGALLLFGIEIGALVLIGIVVGAVGFGLWYGLTQVASVFGWGDFWKALPGALLAGILGGLSGWSLSVLTGASGWFGTAGSWWTRLWAGGLGKWLSGGLISTLFGTAFYLFNGILEWILTGNNPMTMSGFLSTILVSFFTGTIGAALSALFVKYVVPAAGWFSRLLTRIGKSIQLIFFGSLVGVISTVFKNILQGKITTLEELWQGILFGGIASIVGIFFTLNNFPKMLGETIKTIIKNIPKLGKLWGNFLKTPVGQFLTKGVDWFRNLGRKPAPPATPPTLPPGTTIPALPPIKQPPVRLPIKFPLPDWIRSK